MAANQKVKIQETDNSQIGDIMASISALGSNSLSEESVVERNPEPVREKSFSSEKRIVTKKTTEPARNLSASAKKADKPGYVSLVIPNSLKTEWKVYSSEHRMTLTECMKLAMRLLKEMEQKEAITIDDGFITYQIKF